MFAKIDDSVLKDYRRYLHRYALQQVRDPDLASDLVQDTFLAALEGGCRFEGRSAIRTWLVESSSTRSPTASGTAAARR